MIYIVGLELGYTGDIDIRDGSGITTPELLKDYQLFFDDNNQNTYISSGIEVEIDLGKALSEDQIYSLSRLGLPLMIVTQFILAE